MPTLTTSPLQQAHIHLQQGRLQQAWHWLQRVEQRDGAFFDLLGQLEELRGRPQAALAAYRQGAALRQTPATLHNNLGVLCRRLGYLDEAQEHLALALRRRPEPRVISNYALLHQARGELPLARAYLALAHEMAPDDDRIAWNLSQVQLALGDLEKGWEGYEAGLRCGVRRPTPQHTPRWDGSPVTRLHINAEQGLGDEIMFATCLEDAQQACDQLSWEADRRLIPLLARAHPQVDFLPRAAFHVPADAHLPMGSLAPRLRRNRDDFPRRPTLRADPARVSQWRERLAGLGPGLKLGLSWAGGQGWERLKRRAPESFSLSLLRLPGIHWLDLQYDDEPLRPQLHAAGLRHFPDLDAKNDLESLAALIAALDGVVTLSNTTAHLAGALGARVVLILPANPGWRWFGEHWSPWYLQVRLLRQGQDGWAGQAARLARLLTREWDQTWLSVGS